MIRPPDPPAGLGKGPCVPPSRTAPPRAGDTRHAPPHPKEPCSDPQGPRSALLAPRSPPALAAAAGPFDEQQFVVKCKGRAFTFMCDTLEGRTRWIKNISLLAGCSASTEVCHKTTTMGH